MYLLGVPTTINWVIEKTDKTVTISDLHVVIIDALGNTVFLPVQALTPPTTTTEGLAEYVITPDTEGLWEVNLVTGAAQDYTELSKSVLYVFDNITEIYPIGYNAGSLDILGV